MVHLVYMSFGLLDNDDCHDVIDSIDLQLLVHKSKDSVWVSSLLSLFPLRAPSMEAKLTCVRRKLPLGGMGKGDNAAQGIRLLTW